MIASSYLLESNDPGNWLCDRATYMQSIISGSGVQVATGGIGGSQYYGHEYNLLAKALDCDAINITSIHGYMATEKQWTPYVPALSDKAEAAGKLAMIEEWGVTTTPTDDSVSIQAELFNKYGVPWVSCL